MGYHIVPGMVEENIPLLTTIKANAEAGHATQIDAPLDQISREQYRIRRILKATEVLITEAGGEFAGLGRNLRIRQENATLMVEPKSTGKVSIKRISEADILDSMETRKGSMTVLEFFPSPSFNIEEFAAALEKKGWHLFPEAVQELGEGKVMYPAERVEEEPEGFDALL